MGIYPILRIKYKIYQKIQRLNKNIVPENRTRKVREPNFDVSTDDKTHKEQFVINNCRFILAYSDEQA